MAWHELKGKAARDSSNEGVGASAVVERAGRLTRCDARSIWARASNFGGYSRVRPGTRGSGQPVRCVPVAVELKQAASAEERKEVARYVQSQLVYNTGPNGDLFWTGWAPVDVLPTLSQLKGVHGWRIGLENIPAYADAVAPGGEVERMTDTSDQGGLVAPPVIGIIDHGIAVAHAAFRSASDTKQTRVLALWDQDPSRRPNNDAQGPWRAVPGMQYGGELTHATLQGLIDDIGREDLIYEHLQYEPVQTRFSHGTHVLDLAAGHPNPLAVDPAASAFEAASNSPILAVQLPYRPAKDSSGSALCVHILDALHYIERRAPANRNIVINLSDGAYGGAHDGQSMLERAIDDFLQRHQHVTLVLAAGNAHESAGHARASEVGQGRSASFGWRVLPDDYTDSFLEIWFDKTCPKGAVALTLAPPGGHDAVVVEMGQTQTLLDKDGGVIGAVISLESGPDSADRSMFLVAIAPTRPADRAGDRKPFAPHGLWSVRVDNKALATVDVDAWIERDNPVVNESGPRRQSYFEDRACSPQVVDGQRTLGNLAGSGEAIVVGGRYRRGRIFGGCDPAAMSPVARYSSRGPSRAGTVSGPDLVAPSDDSPVLHGLLAAANRSGTQFRLDGTSVAAPLVTRRIVNLLGSANPPKNRDEIMAAMIGAPAPDPESSGVRGTIEPGREPSRGGSR